MVRSVGNKLARAVSNPLSREISGRAFDRFSLGSMA